MAMTAEGLICTKALGHIGIQKVVESLEDATEEGAACARYLDDARRSLLFDYPWGFTTRRGTLPPLVTAVESRTGYSYYYDLPADALHLQYIYPHDQATYVPMGYPWSVYPYLYPYGVLLPRANQKYPFKIEASLVDDKQVICCDLPPAVMACYTYDMAVYGKMPEHFVLALSWYLAKYLVMPLSIDAARQKNIETYLPIEVGKAWYREQDQQEPDKFPESEMVTVRL